MKEKASDTKNVDDTRRITFRLPATLHRELKVAAALRDQSVNRLIQEVLGQWVTQKPGAERQW